MVTVRSTQPVKPYPLIDDRLPVHTERLTIRPFVDSDVHALHELRSQPEVMQWTTQLTPDPDLAATAKRLKREIVPDGNLTYNFALCDRATGALLGGGGCNTREGELGWPEIGYTFRKEAWGKGLGTEFVRGFLKMYWALPRVEVQLEVDKDMVEVAEHNPALARECIVAVTDARNIGSNKVLQKNGWRHVKSFQEPDLKDPAEQCTLYGWIATL